MASLVRVGIVRDGDTIAHLTVMCAGCVKETQLRLPAGVRIVVRDYGLGGHCELCLAELQQGFA